MNGIEKAKEVDVTIQTSFETTGMAKPDLPLLPSSAHSD
jgi:hypothetical protein